MQILSGFTTFSHQSLAFALSDGSRFTLQLDFRTRQQGWFFELTYGDFVVQGQRLTVHPNILRPFRNLVPFGIAVVTGEAYEPQSVEALTDGTLTLYLYEGTEVDEVDAIIET